MLPSPAPSSLIYTPTRYSTHMYLFLLCSQILLILLNKALTKTSNVPLFQSLTTTRKDASLLSGNYFFTGYTIFEYHHYNYPLCNVTTVLLQKQILLYNQLSLLHVEMQNQQRHQVSCVKSKNMIKLRYFIVQKRLESF